MTGLSSLACLPMTLSGLYNYLDLEKAVSINVFIYFSSVWASLIGKEEKWKFELLYFGFWFMSTPEKFDLILFKPLDPMNLVC